MQQRIMLGKASGHDAKDAAQLSAALTALAAQPSEIGPTPSSGPPTTQTSSELSSLLSATTSAEAPKKSLQEALTALSIKQEQALNKDPFSQILKNNR